MNKKLIKIISLIITSASLFSLVGCSVNIDKDIASKIAEDITEQSEEKKNNDKKDSDTSSDEEETQDLHTINPSDALIGTGSLAEQIACIVANRSVWEITESNGSDSYAITDLDNDSHYEIICITNGGSGNYTYTKIYEVNNECSGIDLIAQFSPNLTGEYMPNILDEVDWFSSDINYSLLSDGTYCYEMFNAWSVPTMNYGCETIVLSIGSSDITTERLVNEEVSNGEVTCYDASGNQISDYDYETAFDSIMLAGETFGSIHIEYTIPYNVYSPFTDVSDTELVDILTTSANGFAFFVG